MSRVTCTLVASHAKTLWDLAIPMYLLKDPSNHFFTTHRHAPAAYKATMPSIPIVVRSIFKVFGFVSSKGIGKISPSNSS